MLDLVNCKGDREHLKARITCAATYPCHNIYIYKCIHTIMKLSILHNNMIRLVEAVATDHYIYTRYIYV